MPPLAGQAEAITVQTSGGAIKPISYDANGNMLSDGARTFVWDAANRLSQVTPNAK